jgi:tetratricopeptide (TPR) repeat protein
LGYLVYVEQTRPDSVRAELFTASFANSVNSEVRISNLAGLFRLKPYAAQARDLFFGLPADQRQTLFSNLTNPSQVNTDVLIVIQGLYQDSRLDNTISNNQLLKAMAQVLHQIEDNTLGAQVLSLEIDYWRKGREEAATGNSTQAIEQYALALELNESKPNPNIFLDQGVTYAVRGDYAQAMTDLQQAVEIDSSYEEQVKTVISQDSGLYTFVGSNRSRYTTIAAWFPTLTPTPTSTYTPTPTSTSTPTPTPTPTTTPTPTSTPLANSSNYFAVWDIRVSPSGCSARKEAQITRSVRLGVSGFITETWAEPCANLNTSYSVNKAVPVYVYPPSLPDKASIMTVMGRTIRYFSKTFEASIPSINGEACNWVFNDYFDWATGWLVRRQADIVCPSGIKQTNIDILIDTNIPIGIGW